MKTVLQCCVVILCVSSSGYVNGGDDEFVVETDCAQLTLVIDRTFGCDANWFVTEQVEQDGNEITVELEINGDPVCTDVITPMTFEVPLGAFPNGNYDVVVLWVYGKFEAGEQGPVSVEIECDRDFLRGDADNSGEVSAIADALYLLHWGFEEGPEPPCNAAADVDGNGKLNALTDALYLLRWNFQSGAEPPDPGPDECGPDPDDAGCDSDSEECSTD